MHWTLISAATRVATPWPNGRGTARDYARREDANGALLWLVTLADLVEDAPFSMMPFERVFTIASGGAVELTIDSVPTRIEPLRPVRFSGQANTHCRLLDGQARAFNLMHAPGLRADVSPVRDGTTGPGEHVVFCISTEVRVGGLRLSAGDAAHGTGPALVSGTALVATIG